jgi:enamine deaminase RidA (YjgF/YER057c/UK114 family)
VSAETRLVELGIILAPPVAPVANYRGAVRCGPLVYLSGHGPVDATGQWRRGKVGRDLDLEAARDAARLTTLSLLSTLRDEIGSIDRVTKIVKVFGMVNCAPGFNQMPEVINGCSDLLVEVFGDEIGRHARSAVGMSELPMDIAVEIEMICQVE